MNHFNLVILISGNGSNLQAIINAIQQQKLAATIAAVISNNADAYGLQRAQQVGIPTHVVSHHDYTDREQFDQALQKQIDIYQPKLIVLSGFMRILSPEFVAHYVGRLINIHPSLLPAYRGTHTYVRALAAGEKFHGSSVHFVTDELDGGPLIAQASLAIYPVDTPDSLRIRTQQLEHRLYPKVIHWLATAQVQWQHDQVKWCNTEFARKATSGFLQLEESDV